MFGAPAGVQPKPKPNDQEVAEFNRNLVQQESRMQRLMQQIRDSPYMPTREQSIQLATTVLTLLIMMLLGPAIGPQLGLIQPLIKQLVPLIVAATVHFAADRAVPMRPIVAPPAVDAQIAPVQVQPSPSGQLL